MTTKEILKSMLKDIIPYINGEWFVGDGALLGITRDKDLIEWDNDIDLFFLPDTTIDLPVDSPYKTQKYYMDTKLYNINNNKNTLNPWSEYCSYYNQTRKLNRRDLFNKASKSYKKCRIEAEFTTPYIDIFHLTRDKTTGLYSPKFWDYYYTVDDLKLQKNNDLGYEIYIPNNQEEILTRQYGNWQIPNKDFKY